MKIFSFILFLLFLFPVLPIAQKQNNIWYFGDKAGLDFNFDPPKPISSNLFTLEGTACISDPAGHLLFYTNGATIWDRNHNIMPNGSGLTGGESSTQAALIVPLPNSCSKYYVFTTEDHMTDGGLAYSIVDMCLNNGFGDVVSGNKNKIVVNQSTEKVTSILHANGTDIWIITHRLGSKEFLSYLLTSAGLTATPVVSSIGSFYDSNAYIGPAKASHDGKKVVSSASFYDICEMFDFNRSSGQLSNFYDINQLFGSQQWVYGVEFSPNDSILYLSTFYVKNYLYQIDLKTKQLTTLNSISGNYHYGALQMGPDKKIYMARNLSPFLDVILQPNLSGTACQYDESGIALSSGTTSQSGLPNFASYSFFLPGNSVLSLGNDTTLCQGDSIILKIDAPSNCPTSLLWNDGSSLANKVVTLPGTYWVEINNSCTILRDSIIIDEVPFPDITFHDTTLCNNETIQLNATFPGASYLWSDGSTGPTLSVNSVGSYWVNLTNACFSNTEFAEISFASFPFISFNDTTICEGEVVTFDASAPGVTYLWSDNSTSPLRSIGLAGQYWIELNNSCTTYRDSFQVDITPRPNVLFQDTDFCSGSTLVLDATFPDATYIWSDGSTQSSIHVEKPGSYWVDLTNSCFTIRKFVDITNTPLPDVTFDDITLCKGNHIFLNASFPGATYLWSDNSTLPTLRVNEEGQYRVVISNECGFDTAIAAVSISDCDFNVYMPNVFSPNGDGFNEGIKPFFNTELLNYQFMIFDRWGNCVFISTDPQETWKGDFKNKKANQGVYAYFLDCESVLGIRKKITGDITLIR